MYQILILTCCGFDMIVQIQNSIRRATTARINEASIRIREHLAATSQPPLEQNSLALRYFATQHARDQMELNQQSPSTQPIVNSVLSTRLAAKWRMSNKLSEGDWIAALER